MQKLHQKSSMLRSVFIVVATAMFCLLAQADPNSSDAGAAAGVSWSTADESTLLVHLRNAAEEGLDPDDYLLDLKQQSSHESLSRAALAYISDVHRGRADLEALDSDVELPRTLDNDANQLALALRSHGLSLLLAQAPPSDPQYQDLKRALAYYRSIRDRGGWPTLPSLSSSMSQQEMDLLRNRLAMEDERLAADPNADLITALKRFQANHGLQPDGHVGAQTLAELNISADARVWQIEANMERWRWLSTPLEADYIAINVPDASLKLVLNGHEVLRSRVVVGKPSSRTPILRAEGAGITVNPPWNVPDSIARKEILPKLKTNPDYLLSQDMILVNGPPDDPHGLHVHWANIQAGSFPFHVQQHPGKKNALGTIKIELPNRFHVYLHDTPVKQAFERPARDISHGCVRVEQILPLASYALYENLDEMGRISEMVSSGQTKYLPLERKLPVYFLYWTAFFDKNGSLQFRPDIYGRDRRLIAQLRKPSPVQVSSASIGCSKT